MADFDPRSRLPPGSVDLTAWTDSAGRVRYALSPDGRVWRILLGSGVNRNTDLPSELKPVMMGSKGSRSPYFKLDSNAKGPTSLAVLMRTYFPGAEPDIYRCLAAWRTAGLPPEHEAAFRAGWAAHRNRTDYI